MSSKEVIYDIETLPNLFLCTVFDPKTGMVRVFRAGYGRNMSDRTEEIWDITDYILWLQKKGYIMVGFNNYHYDYPILHYILNNIKYFDVSNEDELCRSIFEFSNGVITEAAGGNRFKYTIWDRDMIVPQLDLFKVHHFDNKAKTVSLKRLEFNMRRASVLEYTQGFDHLVDTREELERLIGYNIEDVMATFQFRLMSEEQVSFRKSLVPTWGIQVLNYNDTKLGEKLIENKLREEVGVGALYKYEEGDYGETIRTMRQTPREYVDVADIIFSNVSFKARALRNLLERLKTLRVFVNGARFEWSPRHDYQMGDAIIAEKELELAGLEKKSEKWLACKEELDRLKKEYADQEISVKYHGAVFEIGKGGIHSAVPWGVFKKGEGKILLDVDVASFYPSIAIEYGMKPEHLPDEFIGIYADLKRERMMYKKTDPVKAKMLKLALNGTYGKTNSVYSVLYDPEYSLRTVINGQLFLLMLWDNLVEALPTIELIQANTDGISFVLHEEDKERCEQVLKEWEKLTRMELEVVEYESMFIRDVNNYVAKDIDGKVKAKGAYNWKELYTGSSDSVVWHKNHSNVISQMAACAFLLDGIDIGQFIGDERDVFNFFLCSNVNRSSRLYWGEEEIQRNSRYLVTLDGKELTKVMPPIKGKTEERRIAVNKGQKVTICNLVSSRDAWDYDIDYNFYVNEALELVKGFILE